MAQPPTSERDDGALLAAAADDPAAFGAFYRRHERLVLGWLARRTAGIEEAADLTAETFAAAWLSRERYEGGEAGAAPWLLGIARNKLRMSARKQRIERSALERLGVARTPVDEETANQLTALFSDAEQWLTGLPPEQRAAVRAHVLDDESYPELAGRLGIAEPAARQRVSRGLAVLRRRLTHEGARP